MNLQSPEILLRRILNRIAVFERRLDELVDSPRILYATPDEIFVAGPDGVFLAFPADELNHAISWLNPQFDRGLRRFLGRRLGLGYTFLDIGTNVGAIAAYAARKVGNSGRVVTVEPLSNLVYFISRNLKINAPLVSHTHYEGVIGGIGSDAKVPFFPHKLDSRVSSMSPSEHHNNQNMLKVSSHSILEIWPAGSEPLVVKIDVEGAEVDVLRQLFDQAYSVPHRSIDVIFEFAPEHLERTGPGTLELEKLLASHSIVPQRINDKTGELGHPLSQLNHFDTGNLFFHLGPEASELSSEIQTLT